MSAKLTAVQYDAKRTERSFAVFDDAVQGRPRIVHRGTRIAGYELASIEPGGVVLTAEKGPCSLRLQGAVAERELRTISVAVVRGKLRARKAAVISEQSLRSRTLARRDGP